MTLAFTLELRFRAERYEVTSWTWGLRSTTMAARSFCKIDSLSMRCHAPGRPFYPNPASVRNRHRRSRHTSPTAMCHPLLRSTGSRYHPRHARYQQQRAADPTAPRPPEAMDEDSRLDTFVAYSVLHRGRPCVLGAPIVARLAGSGIGAHARRVRPWFAPFLDGYPRPSDYRIASCFLAPGPTFR
jgi:hypothetical protein